jgi:hypothetical protein
VSDLDFEQCVILDNTAAEKAEGTDKLLKDWWT